MNGCVMLLLSILWMFITVSHGYLPCPREKFCSCLGNNIYCERASVKDIPWKRFPSWVELISLREIYDLKHLSASSLPLLPKLKKLNITSCRKLVSVGGDLPSKLPNLYLLRITQSGLTTSPAFDSVGHALQILILNNNNLTTLDPRTTRSMPMLKHLEVNHNRLTSLKSSWFKKGNQIRFLSANRNQISRLSPDLGTVLTKLRVLFLNKNRLRALAPPPASRKYSREHAVCAGGGAANRGDAGATEPVILPGMPSVEHLELGRNRMVFIDSLTFQDWRSLKTLVLRKNNLCTPKTGAFYIEEGGGLRELDLMGNPSIDRLDFKWAYGFDSLQRLIVARCGIRVIDKSALALMGAALRHLDLSANKLQRLEAGLWSSLKRLRVLKLAGNSLTRLPTNAFKGLTELRELSLGVNSLARLSNREGNAFKSVFAPLGNLTILDLSFNRLTRISMADLQGPAAGLQQLLLNGNNLTRLEAPAFTQLSHLSHLRLDSTHLTCDCDAAAISTWLHSSPKLSQGARSANCSQPAAFARKPLLALHGLPFATACAKRKRPASPPSAVFRPLPAAAARRPTASPSNTGTSGRRAAGGIGQVPADNRSVELLRGAVLLLRCTSTLPPHEEEPTPADKLPVFPTKADSDPVTFRWFRQLNQLKIPLVSDPPRVTIRTGVRPGLRPQWYSELKVSAVDLQDAGTYRCFVERSNPRLEPDLSPLFNVSVYVPPKFTDKPNAVISAMAGENIHIPCAASGHPPPHSSLRKRGGKFFSAAKDHRLSFFIGDPNFLLSGVKREDAGDYSCESVNAGGNISQPFRLVVNEIPRLKGRPAAEQDFDAGQPAVLACKAEGWPFPQVKWMKDGKQLKLRSSVRADKRTQPTSSAAGGRLRLNSRDQLLVFTHVTPADAGVYVCALQNVVGRREARIVVNVRTSNGVYPGDPSRISREKANWMMSNMTSIVVIAVVSCVVVTSIVWVAALFCLKRRLRRKACARAASLVMASDSAKNLSTAPRYPSSSLLSRNISPLLSSSIYVTSLTDSLAEVELAEQMSMLQERRAIPPQTRPNILIATTTFHAPGDSAPASPISSTAPPKALTTKVPCDDVEAPSSGYNSGNSDYSVGLAGGSGSEESSSGEQLSLRSLSSAGVYAQPPRLNIRRRSDSEEEDDDEEEQEGKALCSVAVTDLSARLPDV